MRRYAELDRTERLPVGADLAALPRGTKRRQVVAYRLCEQP